MIIMMNGYGCIKTEDEYICRHHRHEIRDNQCSSSLVKHIKAPVHLVSLFSFRLFFQVVCLSMFLNNSDPDVMLCLEVV